MPPDAATGPIDPAEMRRRARTLEALALSRRMAAELGAAPAFGAPRAPDLFPGVVEVRPIMADVLRVEGPGLSAEFLARGRQNCYLAFSDGTVLRASPGDGDGWRLALEAEGSARATFLCLDGRSPDRVTLVGDVRWVLFSPFNDALARVGDAGPKGVTSDA